MAEYRSHFETNYCRGPIETFDGIEVRFRKRDFYHCFFDSVATQDDTFSVKRAERMLWLKAALRDPNAELRVGWNSKKKRPAVDRRVAIVQYDYVVIIVMTGQKEADFVTAFIAGEVALRKIRTNPKWTKKIADSPGWLSDNKPFWILLPLAENTYNIRYYRPISNKIPLIYIFNLLIMPS